MNITPYILYNKNMYIINTYKIQTYLNPILDQSFFLHLI